jgi:hypothetical protein
VVATAAQVHHETDLEGLRLRGLRGLGLGLGLLLSGGRRRSRRSSGFFLLAGAEERHKGQGREAEGLGHGRRI